MSAQQNENISPNQIEIVSTREKRAAFVLQAIRKGEPWQTFSECRKSDPETFFQHNQFEDALEICGGCEVIKYCLDFAYKHRDKEDKRVDFILAGLNYAGRIKEFRSMDIEKQSETGLNKIDEAAQESKPA